MTKLEIDPELQRLQRMDLEKLGRTKAEKRKLIRKQDQHMRESDNAKTRIRNDPKYAKVDESLHGERGYNFFLRVVLGASFTAIFFWSMYDIYVKFDVFLQIGENVTYGLVGSMLGLFVSFFLVKRRAFKRSGEKINYRDLHQKASWRHAAYEAIALLLNSLLTTYGLFIVIRTLPFKIFLLYFVAFKVSTRGIAWLIARYMNRRGFLVVGVVAIVIVVMFFAVTPMLSIIAMGGT